jgi:hypothetical protein
MSTAELIYDRAKSLPEELRQEALHYLDYLQQRRQAERDDRDWAAMSAAELAQHYAPEDAIYDKE